MHFFDEIFRRFFALVRILKNEKLNFINSSIKLIEFDQ